jgi:hypothetical protein
LFLQHPLRDFHRTGRGSFLSAHAKDPQAAKALLAYLTGPEAAKVYRERGMQPGR